VSIPLLKIVLRSLISLLFVASAITHFAKSDMFVRIVPPFLPWPLGLVWISGFFEILGGLGLLIPTLRRHRPRRTPRRRLPS
jgi:uncharacterized membrane protein